MRLLLLLTLAGCSVGAAVAEEPAPKRAPAAIRALAVGDRHACALLATGRVFCWGSPDCGATGGADRVLEATEVENLDDVSAIAAADQQTCVIRRGSVVCFGAARHPRHDWGSEECTNGGPRIVATGAKRLAMGRFGMCIVTEDRHVKCSPQWRRREPSCELGPSSLRCTWEGASDRTLRPEWWTWNAIDDAIDVAVGMHHACVLREGGEVVCHGWDAMGSFAIASRRPIAPSIAIAAGTDSTCTLSAEGVVACAGVVDGTPIEGNAAQVDCAFGTTCVRHPVEAAGRYRAIAMSGDMFYGYTYAATYQGTNTSCAIDLDGRVQCKSLSRYWSRPERAPAIESPAIAIAAGANSV